MVSGAISESFADLSAAVVGRSSPVKSACRAFLKNLTKPPAVCQEIVGFFVAHASPLRTAAFAALRRAEPERVTAGSAMMRRAIRGILR
jgi:hypothetical protein